MAWLFQKTHQWVSAKNCNSNSSTTELHQFLGTIGTANTLRPRQNGRHFADDIFKYISLNENVSIPIKVSPNFVPKGVIDNIPALAQIMAWHWPGDKPLSKPMMFSLLTYICITPPQWVKKSSCTYQQWRRVSSLIGSASYSQPGQQTVAVAGPWPAGCWWRVVTSSPGEAAGKERDTKDDIPQGRLSTFQILKLKLHVLWEEKWPIKLLHCIEGQLWIAWLDNMLLVPECLGRELDSMLSSHVKL